MTRRPSHHPRVRARLAALLLALSLTLLAPVAAQSNGQPASSVLGQPDFVSTLGTFGAQGLHEPAGVAVDQGNGKVYVVDTFNNRVLRYASAVALATYAPAEAVLGQPDFTTATAGTSATSLNGPAGVAVSIFGQLWVADSNNNRVLGFVNPGTKANGAAADIVLGQPDFTSSTAATTQTGMSGPTDVAVNDGGELWVLDAGNVRVLSFIAQGTGAPASKVLGQPDFVTVNPDPPVCVPTASSFSEPNGLALDDAGNLWVSDGNCRRIVRFNEAFFKPNGGAADAVLGQAALNQVTYRGPSSSSVEIPYGMTVDAAGALWVADAGFSRVVRFPNAAVAANNAAADLVLGQPNFTTVDPGPGPTRMSSPQNIGIGGADIWISDTNNNRVLRFSTDPAQIPPFGRSWLPLVNR